MCRKVHEANQKLAHSKEDELARATQLATIAGKPLLPATLRQMGNGIMKRCVKGVNEEGSVLVEYEPMGKKWPERFMKRQSKLQTEWAEKIELVRSEVTVESLEEFFVELRYIVQEFNIQEEDIYNMNETGFNIGDYKTWHVVVDTSVQFRYQAQPGRQEWVTAVECICADGFSVPPLIIFTGKTFVKQ